MAYRGQGAGDLFRRAPAASLRNRALLRGFNENAMFRPCPLGQANIRLIEMKLRTSFATEREVPCTDVSSV
jgi:hypothetical protein